MRRTILLGLDVSTDLKCELDQDGGLVNNLTQNHFLNIEIFELLQVKSPPKHLSDTFFSDLYLKKGFSLRQISNKLKCSRKVVRKRISSQNIAIRVQKISVNEKILKLIKDMRGQGESYKRIATYLNTKNFKTITKKGKWHAKTVRKLYLAEGT